LTEITETVSRWSAYAIEASVDKSWVPEIGKHHRLQICGPRAGGLRIK
jgi:hypothetical protein